MFEVGFTEIILIMGLALLVLGPEKLPALAEKVGRWTGRARAMARQLRTQLEQEVTLEEMNKSRPMQAPPPAAESASQAPTPQAAATPLPDDPAPPVTPTAEATTTTPDGPHNTNAAGLDLETMVSGMEPPPQSPAETPAATNKAVH